MSEPIRSTVIVVLLVVLFGGIAYSDLDAAHQIRWVERQQIDDGVNIVIASAPHSIDASVCEQIATHPGFLHSGSFSDSGNRVLADDGVSLIPSGTMSVGFLDLVDQGLPRTVGEPGVFVGEELSRHFDLPVGALIELTESSPRVVGVIKGSGRSASIAGWMISVEPASGMADHCWAETEQGLRATGEAIMRSLFTADEPIDFTTLIGHDADTDPASQLQSRLAATAMWPIIIAIALVARLTIYARRSEYGLCRALNMRAWHILFITEVEWLTLALPAVILGYSLSIIAIFFRWSGVSDVPLLWGADTALIDTLPVLAATIIIPSLTATLSRTNPAQALKDR